MVSDHEIIRRVQAGERELFGELHTRHHDRVYRYVARSIFQREAAQDVAGEVWLRAYRAVDRFEAREGAGVLSWLLRIATNAVTDYRRRLEPETQSWDDDETPTLRLLSGLDPNRVAPAAEAVAMRRERADAVHHALNHLSAGDRQIIYLAHQNELSCAEIAAILDKPSISAVTSHLHRAMNHLREKLSEEGWFGEEEISLSPAATFKGNRKSGARKTANIAGEERREQRGDGHVALAR